MRTRLAILTLLLAVLALTVAACGGDDAETATKPKETPGATTAGCQEVAAPEPKADGDRKAPKTELDDGKTYVATVVTNCGTFEITLDSKRAPKTGGSFVELTKDGFFDGLPFHRVVAGFVIQGGDPKGDGTGGPGFSVVEKPPADLQYVRGVVAMAKTATEKPGTSGSQFFVVTGEDAGLPPEYALLGKVTKGQDVVDTIGTVQTGANEQPAAPVVIEKITIAES